MQGVQALQDATPRGSHDGRIEEITDLRLPARDGRPERPGVKLRPAHSLNPGGPAEPVSIAGNHHHTGATA